LILPALVILFLVALTNEMCFVVCTCVVHKRCHQNVVTKCPKEKDSGVDASLVSTTAAAGCISIVIVLLAFIVFIQLFKHAVKRL